MADDEQPPGEDEDVVVVVEGAPEELDMFDDLAALRILEAYEAAREQQSGQCTVYNLYCKCSRWLTGRGQSVFLVADPSTRLFSSDMSCDEKEKEPAVKIATCECLIKGLECRACGQEVGYHVVAPCGSCMAAAHNNHYWMFTTVEARPRVTAEGARLQWSDLAAEPTGGPCCPLEPHSVPLCCVCACSNTVPARLERCGHDGLCAACAMRAVDLRRCCPLCRTAATVDEVTIVDDPLIRVRCRYGCELVADEWQPRAAPHGCPEYFALGTALLSHQQHCPHRTPPPDAAE